MTIKLHTCGFPWAPGGHPCHKVKSALEEAGIEHEVVKNPTQPRSRRKYIEEHTGQQKLPVIEFADGRFLREETKDLVERIRAGNLTQS